MDRLIRRELLLSARRPGLWLAIALHAVFSLLFLEAWGGTRGVPLLAGTTLYEQIVTLQFAFVLVAAPWMAARIVTPFRRSDGGRMALLFGVDSAVVTRAQAIVISAWVLLLCGAAFPAAILAEQMSPLTSNLLGFDQLVMFAAACAAALLSTRLARWTDHAVARWLVASGAALLMWVLFERGTA